MSELGIREVKLLPEKSVLIVGIGSTIGKTGLLRKAGGCNQQIHAILPNKNVLPEFTYFQFIKKSFQVQFISNSSSTTLPIINKSRFCDLNFILPSLAEQTEIVSRVENLFSKADKIEASYQILKEKTDALPQAILGKAFRGELAEQLPSDGDARDLLEEIRKMKKSAGGK